MNQKKGLDNFQQILVMSILWKFSEGFRVIFLAHTQVSVDGRVAVFILRRAAIVAHQQIVVIQANNLATKYKTSVGISAYAKSN